MVQGIYNSSHMKSQLSGLFSICIPFPVMLGTYEDSGVYIITAYVEEIYVLCLL